jgi:hypothetical protein
MSNYIGYQPAREIVQYSGSRFDYVNTGDPAVDTNPQSVGATWLNLTTGEEFVCIDNLADSNYWVGSLSTVVNVITALSAVAWWDFGDPDSLYTDNGVSLVAANNDSVYLALDKSGNSNHFIQATSSARPLYKTNYQNGLSGIYGDGANHFMVTASQIVSDDDFTVLAAITPTALSGLTVLCQHSGVTDVGRTSFFASTGSNPYYPMLFFNNGTSYVAAGTTPLGATTPFIWSTESDGAGTSRVYNNDSSYEGEVTGQTWTPLNNPMSIFGFSSGSGLGEAYLMEVAVFTPKLSDSDRILARDFMNRKWSIY